MDENKNVKVPEQTHKQLVLRAEALGMKKGVLADTLLRVGLNLTDREIQDAVVNLRQPTITPPKGSTNPELPPEQ